MRTVWAFFGLASLGLGIIGIFLPILPTVPFLLLAAFCFARSSHTLHSWLICHSTLGPPIKDWNQNGAIRRSAKIWASISVALAFILSIVMEIKISVLIIQAVILTCVLVFIWSRPIK